MRLTAAGAMLPAMHRFLPRTWPVIRRPVQGAWLLVWLLVALLPLRPMASWAMAPDLQPSPPAAHGDASPCHGHAAMEASAAGAELMADPAPANLTPPCHACDLCHAAMACPVIAALHALPAPRAAPAALPLATTRPAPADGVFRPPRA